MSENKLYKYLDLNGAACVLKNHELQFSFPKDFNDLFDCSEDLVDYSHADDHSPDWWPAGWNKRKLENDAENYRRRFCICCLSKECDSMLMWTHYCKQHSGVCIEFDREELSKSLRGWGLYTWNMFGRDVEYRDIRNKPSYDGVNSYLYQLLTKSKDWEYEQEVRLFIDTPSWTLAKDYVPAEEYGVRRSLFRRLKYKYQPCCKDVSKQKFYPSFDPKCIKAIYLGARFPKENVRRIIELAMKANPEVTVLRMRADQDNLRLVPEPVGRPR